MTRRAWVVVGAFMVLVIVVNSLVILVAAKNSGNISTLLTNGKTASAISAGETKRLTVGVNRVVNKIENQLDQILQRSDVNRQLVCSIAAQVRISSSTIVADCSKP